MRGLPSGGPPQRVNSGPFPGAEPHIFFKAKPVKLKKVAFSHFFDILKNTMQRMVFFFGIRRLPIFPPEAPTVRHGRSASQTLLELPALLDLLFASSSTGRAHSRSHHQPSASASLSQTQKTVIAVYETKETDGCQSLLFGIRRLPIFPGRHQPSIFGV